MITKITAALTLGLAASVLVVAPAGAIIPDPNFPNPGEIDDIGVVVPQLPPPYAGDIDGACAVASILCLEPQVAAGLGYAIENGQLRVRLLEGTQIVNALNVEAVIEIRDDGAAYGYLEVIPVCVEIVDGIPGDWTVSGDSATMLWGPEDVGAVIDDVYLDMIITSECDPLLERRDILTIATWGDTATAFLEPTMQGWTSDYGVPPEVVYGVGANTTTQRYEVLSYSWVYGYAGTVTMRYTITGKTGSGYFPDNSQRFNCNVGTIATPTLQNCSLDDVRLHQGWSPSAVGTTRTVTFNVTPTTKELRWYTLGWAPPSAPTFVGGEALSASSLTAYDVFSNIIFAPYSSGAYMTGVDGVCDELSECLARCENPGDLIGFYTWVKCLFEPTVDVNQFWTALKLEVIRSSFVGSINTLGTYLFSPMRAIGAAGKSCGTLAMIPAGAGPFEDGFGIDTCDWAEQYPTVTAWTWALLIALVFIGGAMVILRILEGALGLQDPLIGSQAWRDKEGL